MARIRIGLALSGGGFRASAFHLGVLKRLEELNILPHLKTLSTVSGGSVTGALYAYRCAQNDGKPGSYPVENLIDEMTSFLQHNLRGNALFGTPLKTIKTLISFFTLHVSRANLIESKIDQMLFNGAMLSELPDWICINAINLRTGKNWKFYNDVAGDYLIGVTKNVENIRVSEAVTASAAFPGLMEPYLFKTAWENFSIENMPSVRWDYSKAGSTTNRWRNRYAKSFGRIIIPLMDGGLYDNDGAVSLRSAKITHAIIANATSTESDAIPLNWFSGMRQALTLSNNRLGAVTRQWIHESTHGHHPNEVRKRLLEIADEMDDSKNNALVEELRILAKVGWPPRKRQFNAVAQILLHSPNIARNFCNSPRFEDRWNIPSEDRGLSEDLVPFLSQVRTDLDSFNKEIINLLIAQGYFLTDAYIKIGMMEVLTTYAGDKNLHRNDIRPKWSWAHDIIKQANDAPVKTLKWLEKEAKRKFLGRFK